MPHKITWLVPDHFFHIDWYGNIEIDEFKEFYPRMIKLYDQIDKPLIHAITETTNVITSPNFMEVQPIAGPFTTHPKYGWSILIGEQDPKALITINMMMQKAQARIKILDTVAEAITFLQTVDSTLPRDITIPDHLK